MEEKETNAIRGPWCSSPVASLEHRWLYPYQQPQQHIYHQRKSRKNNRHLVNRRHHNNNNESPPEKKTMPMLLHPPPNLTSRTQHEPDSPQPLDFSVSGVSRYNGHVESLRITGGGGGGGNNAGTLQSLQEADNCSDPEYGARTTSNSSSAASAISDEGSLVHSPGSPDQNENSE